MSTTTRSVFPFGAGESAGDVAIDNPKELLGGKGAGLREMTRVCRPGGRVVVLEFSTPRNRLFGALYRAYFRHVLPRIGQWLARNPESAYQYLPQSVSQFPDGEALTAMFRECGLESVTFRPLTFGIATLYVGVKPGS